MISASMQTMLIVVGVRVRFEFEIVARSRYGSIVEIIYRIGATQIYIL